MTEPIVEPVDQNIQVYYDLVEIHTLEGMMYLRANTIARIGPSTNPLQLQFGKTVVETIHGQFFYTNEPQEQIAKRVKEATLFLVTPKPKKENKSEPG